MTQSTQFKAAYVILTSAYFHASNRAAEEIISNARLDVTNELPTSDLIEASDLACILVRNRY